MAVIFRIVGMDKDEYGYTVHPVVIAAHTGLLFQMMELPKLPAYTLASDQLPAFASNIATYLGYDSELEDISKGRRYEAAGPAEYIHRMLGEVGLLVVKARRHGKELEWITVDN